MVTVPVVTMRVFKGSLNQLDYRLIQYQTDEHSCAYFVQSRLKGHSWGEAVQLERELDQ
jgi:hypothetical protein